MADGKGMVPYSHNQPLSPKEQSAAEQWLEGQSAIARSAIAKVWQNEREKQSAIAALHAHAAQRYRQARDVAWAELETIDRPDERAEYEGYLATSGDSLTRVITEELERGARTIAATADAFRFVPPASTPPRQLSITERVRGRTTSSDE